MLPCECPINNQKLIYILHDHGPAPTIHFQAVICVINRLLNGHCFLEHRCHDIIRKANSTFLSADRSPRQLSKAKKSGSKILKKAYLRVFGRVQYIRKTISTVFPLRNGVVIPPEVAWNTRHATRNTQWQDSAPWLEWSGIRPEKLQRCSEKLSKMFISQCFSICIQVLLLDLERKMFTYQFGHMILGWPQESPLPKGS